MRPAICSIYFSCEDFVEALQPITIARRGMILLFSPGVVQNFPSTRACSKPAKEPAIIQPAPLPIQVKIARHGDLDPDTRGGRFSPALYYTRSSSRRGAAWR